MGEHVTCPICNERVACYEKQVDGMSIIHMACLMEEVYDDIPELYERAYDEACESRSLQIAGITQENKEKEMGLSLEELLTKIYEDTGDYALVVAIAAAIESCEINEEMIRQYGTLATDKLRELKKEGEQND